MEKIRPKIGLALSGSSGRAIAHVAIIEVFQEHGIPIDIIVGCSSGGLIAAAYGAGTMSYVKDVFLNFKWKWLWDNMGFWGSKGGLFHWHNAKADFYKLTKGLKFEDMPVKIGVTASDIQSGELITISQGDVAKALKATVALPGFFEPMIIDNRILVDGGLVNIVPATPVRQMGADIVIGVDLALVKFLYQKKLWFWRIIRRVRRIMGIDYIQFEIIKPLKSLVLDKTRTNSSGVQKKKMVNMFRIFFWGVDHSFNVEEEWKEEMRSCDIMIEPEAKFNSGKLGVKNVQNVYDGGRAAALAAIPKIRELIKQFEEKHEKVAVKQ